LSKIICFYLDLASLPRSVFFARLIFFSGFSFHGLFFIPEFFKVYSYTEFFRIYSLYIEVGRIHYCTQIHHPTNLIRVLRRADHQQFKQRAALRKAGENLPVMFL